MPFEIGINHMGKSISFGFRLYRTIQWSLCQSQYPISYKEASIYDVRSGWGRGSPKSRPKEQNQLICESDKEGWEGFQKYDNFVDIIYGTPKANIPCRRIPLPLSVDFEIVLSPSLSFALSLSLLFYANRTNRLDSSTMQTAAALFHSPTSTLPTTCFWLYRADGLDGPPEMERS